MGSSQRHKQADTSSGQPVGILGGDKKTILTDKELEEILEKLKVDPANWTECLKGVSSKFSKKTESAKHNFKSLIREAKADNVKGKIFRVVLIQEGLGNFKDAFFYTKEALDSAVPQFEGRKIYADHPSALEDEIRPERSTRDILGYFENTEYVETDGQGELQADLCIPPEPSFDWARSMANTAIVYREKYGDKDFVGLSINASGDANEKDIDEVIESASDACKPKLIEAKQKGIKTVRVVSEIQDAVSCDLVTEAGAGGKILKLMEEAKAMGHKEDESKKEAEKKAKEAADKIKKEAQDGDGAADHSDADKDTALFKQLFNKYMGDGGDDDSEGEEADKVEGEDKPHPEQDGVKEKYEAYKEMGMESEDAMKHAVAHHKVEKMKQKKEADKKEAEGHKEADGDGKNPSNINPNKESAKEAVKLAGRVALLERELGKVRLEKYVKNELAKSGLPRKATKLFEEKAGDFKSEKDFNEKFNLFKEAYGADRDEEITYVGGYEKSSTETDKGVSFEDCVK